MADTEGSRDEGDLRDMGGEPEPDRVKDIRGGREERAERLKSLLGKAPSGDAAQGEPLPVEPAGAWEKEPAAGASEPPA
jgi:hypothetical protein